MKKIISLLLVISLLCSLVACTNKPTEGTQDNPTIQTESIGKTESEPTETDEPEVNEQPLHTYWGVTDSFGVEINGLTERYYINVPYYEGFFCGYGKVGEHFDINDPDGLGNKTMTYMQGQSDGSPQIHDLSEVLPAYFEEMQVGLIEIYGGSSKNFKIEITEKQPNKIGEYDMYKFVGIIEFDTRSEHFDFPFIAYATTLKSNGGYAFWMVYDPSPDHMLGELIEEQAYNMAQTFRETE